MRAGVVRETMNTPLYTIRPVQREDMLAQIRFALERVSGLRFAYV